METQSVARRSLHRRTKFRKNGCYGRSRLLPLLLGRDGRHARPSFSATESSDLDLALFRSHVPPRPRRPVIYRFSPLSVSHAYLCSYGGLLVQRQELHRRHACSPYRGISWWRPGVSLLVTKGEEGRWIQIRSIFAYKVFDRNLRRKIAKSRRCSEG